MATPPKLPKLLIRTSTGKYCRVTFTASGDSIAASITWRGASTPEDIAEVNGLVMKAMQPLLAPTANVTEVDLGFAPEEVAEAVVRRFLKANEN